MTPTLRDLRNRTLHLKSLKRIQHSSAIGLTKRRAQVMTLALRLLICTNLIIIPRLVSHMFAWPCVPSLHKCILSARCRNILSALRKALNIHALDPFHTIHQQRLGWTKEGCLINSKAPAGSEHFISHSRSWALESSCICCICKACTGLHLVCSLSNSAPPRGRHNIKTPTHSVPKKYGICMDLHANGSISLSSTNRPPRSPI